MAFRPYDLSAQLRVDEVIISVYFNTVRFPQQVFPGLIHANLFFLHSDCSDYLEANQMNGVRFLAGIS